MTYGALKGTKTTVRGTNRCESSPTSECTKTVIVALWVLYCEHHKGVGQDLRRSRRTGIVVAQSRVLSCDGGPRQVRARQATLSCRSRTSAQCRRTLGASKLQSDDIDEGRSKDLGNGKGILVLARSIAAWSAPVGVYLYFLEVEDVVGMHGDYFARV